MQPDYFALISKSDYPDITIREIQNVSVGVPRNTVHASTFRQWFPNHPKTVEYENMDGAILALQRGEVDLVMSSQRRLMYVTHFLELPGYRTNVVFDQPIQTISGFNKNEEELCSIFDMALKVIDTKGISDRWTRRTYDYRAKVAEGRLPWLIGATTLSLITLALILTLFYRSRNQKAKERHAKEVMEKTTTLTAILDTTPDLIFTKDLESRYTLCNKSFENLVNIPREDIIGKGDAEGLKTPPEIAAAFIAEDQKIFSNNEVVMFEDYLLSHDGTRILFETIKSPLIIDGKVTGLVGIARDITQRKEMARQQAEAEAANKAKSSFLATMSHEMRTPMNAIIGMTSIGKNSKDIERKDYALNKIEDAAVHLLSVINDVLDISKIEANKLELAPIEFNFERMLQKIVNIINFRMDEKHQQFAINVDRKIPRFFIGDDHRLSQVILNLLSNAVKFSPEQGEIVLNVALVNEQDGICEIRTEVSDNGIGIDPEQQAKLFRAFQQADSGISREYGGSGLGLSISKHIVELMGGTIWVESEPGEGSRFIFTVKVERGKKSVASMLAPGIKWENMKILVVDDEPEIYAYFKDLFGQLGINCSGAPDGFQACQIIEEQGSYDIYFVDWRMPGMDGIELTRKIKAHDKDRPSVVVMISSADWAVIKDMALDAGVSKYLLKPLFSSAIIDCVNECLGIDAVNEEDAEMGTGGRFEGKKLLVAEDVEINREIILSLLEDTGLSMDCAQNGLEAVEMIVAAPDKYDAVLMDVQMPKMDGLEATRLIRAMADQHLKRLPIIAMTAHVFKSDIEECIKAGMNDHIGKPIDIDDVMKKLNKYLNKK
jgi:PAS domain S-box-containing protein